MRNTTKKGPKLAPPERPVDKYPYMAISRYGEPKYFSSYPAALTALTTDLRNLRDRMGRFDSRVKAAVNEAITAVGNLSVDGGAVDVEVDPHTGTRYQMELVRRVRAL
jgi:hypothetical protein